MILQAVEELSNKFGSIKLIKNEIYYDNILVSMFYEDKIYIFNYLDQKQTKIIVELINFSLRNKIEFEMCYAR